VLGVGAFNSLQYLALISSSPLNVTLVAASMPVWMLAVGALFYGDASHTPATVGRGAGPGGVCTGHRRGSLDTLLHVRFVPGDGFILLAVIGWAFYSWLLARPPAHMQGKAAARLGLGRLPAGADAVRPAGGQCLYRR
jgi:drug/metabolite transporter (DMT)-like permease